MGQNLYGKNEVYVEPNTEFELHIFTDQTDGNLIWSIDSNFTSILGVDINPIYLNSSLFKNGDKVYAVKGDSNILETTINIYDIYPILPNRFESDTLHHNPVDIDSIYFKYHKCLSGVCYAYVRDINNIYEENYLVSDYITGSTGAYNLYNEFDIIDEFVSNIHEAEVAIDTNLDITTKYKKLDDTYLHVGTRVLLFGQADTSLNNVYTISNDFSLINTNELDRSNSANYYNRYKININSGKYADKQLHVSGYTINNDPLFTISNSYVVKHKLNYNTAYDLIDSGDNYVKYKILFTDYDIARKSQLFNISNYNGYEIDFNEFGIIDDDLQMVQLNYYDKYFNVTIDDDSNYSTILSGTTFINDDHDTKFYISNQYFNINDYVKVTFYKTENYTVTTGYTINGISGDTWYYSGYTLYNNIYEETGVTSSSIPYTVNINKSVIVYKPILKYYTRVIGISGQFILTTKILEDYLINDLKKETNVYYRVDNLNHAKNNIGSITDKIKSSGFGDYMDIVAKYDTYRLIINPLENTKDIYFNYDNLHYILSTPNNTIDNTFYTKNLYNKYTLYNYFYQFYSGATATKQINYNSGTLSATSSTYHGESMFTLTLTNSSNTYMFKEYTYINISTINTSSNFSAVITKISGNIITFLPSYYMPIGSTVSSISTIFTIGNISNILQSVYLNIHTYNSFTKIDNSTRKKVFNAYYHMLNDLSINMNLIYSTVTGFIYENSNGVFTLKIYNTDKRLEYTPTEICKIGKNKKLSIPYNIEGITRI